MHFRSQLNENGGTHAVCERATDTERCQSVAILATIRLDGSVSPPRALNNEKPFFASVSVCVRVFVCVSVHVCMCVRGINFNKHFQFNCWHFSRPAAAAA